jgi:hypothetical protein
MLEVLLETVKRTMLARCRILLRSDPPSFQRNFSDFEKTPLPAHFHFVDSIATTFREMPMTKNQTSGYMIIFWGSILCITGAGAVIGVPLMIFGFWVMNSTEE